MESDSIEMHAIIKGKVQGVGFRAMTCYYAKALDITGTVRNLSDGSVEICAQGTKKKLDELLRRIKNEPGSAKISDASVEYLPIQNINSIFKIIF